jgi:type II secretory pathway pseudopilin PulG
MNHQDMKILVVLSIVGAIAAAGLTLAPTMVQTASAVQASFGGGAAADENTAAAGGSGSASTSRNTFAAGGLIAQCNDQSIVEAGGCSGTGIP